MTDKSTIYQAKGGVALVPPPSPHTPPSNVKHALDPRPPPLPSHRLGALKTPHVVPQLNTQRSGKKARSKREGVNERKGGERKKRRRRRQRPGGKERDQLTRRSNTRPAARATHKDTSSSLEADAPPARLPRPKRPRRHPRRRLLLLQLHLLRLFEEGVPGPPGT